MRQIVIITMLCALGAAGASAQVVPPQLTTFAQDKIFTAANLPGAGHHQIHMIPYPNQPGSFIVALTADNLPTANGGLGGYDLVTGVFDAVKQTFTPDLHAAGLNGAQNEFGLMLYHDGLLAVYETASFLTPPNTNEVFVALPEAAAARMERAGFVFYRWGGADGAGGAGGRATVRLVTSFDSDADDVDALLAAARGA